MELIIKIIPKIHKYYQMPVVLPIV